MKDFSAVIQAKFFKFKRIYGIYRDFWYFIYNFRHFHSKIAYSNCLEYSLSFKLFEH